MQVYSGDEAAAAYAKHLSLHGEARCAQGHCSQRTSCTAHAGRLLRLRQEGRSARPPRARGPAGTGARARRSRRCCRSLQKALRERAVSGNTEQARRWSESAACSRRRQLIRQLCEHRLVPGGKDLLAEHLRGEGFDTCLPAVLKVPHARVCSAWSALEPLEVAPAAAQGASHKFVLQGALVQRLRS